MSVLGRPKTCLRAYIPLNHRNMPSLIKYGGGFMSFYFLAWKRGVDFSGCSSREEFWMFFLIHMLVTIVCISLDIVMGSTTWFDAIYGVASFIPMLSAIARRLHDIAKSGYWGLVFFIPAIGPFWLVYLLIQPTSTHQNAEVSA